MPPQRALPSPFRPLTLAAALQLCAAGATLAQAPVVDDGRWRAAFGLGASLSSGNSRAGNLSLTADAVRATPANKISLYGKANYAKTDDAPSEEQLRLGGRYDHNFAQSWFTYVSGELEHNTPANLDLRSQLGAGLGYHVLRGEAHSFDMFSGLSYAEDRYIGPTLIDDRIRRRFGYPSLMLGEESTHKLSPTAHFKQRLTLLPNLESRGEFRANLDAGLAVAINKTINLNVGLAVAHNSEPGPGRKSTDALLTTGVSVTFD